MKQLPLFAWGTRWREPLGEGYVYCRCSLRICRGRSVRLLDLADAWLPEGERGRGQFTAFLERAEALVEARGDYDGIYVENVLNPLLNAFLRRRQGYAVAPLPGNDGPPSFLRLKDT